MPDTIESFVKKIKEDGLQAGKEAAQKELASAKQEAELIISSAQEKADKIIDNARTQVAIEKKRQQNELQLAARDTVLLLQKQLQFAITTTLASNTNQVLKNGSYLADLIKNVVLEYAKADGVNPHANLSISVYRDNCRDAVERTITQLTEESYLLGKLKLHMDYELGKPGFEYTLNEATVEITSETVVQYLKPYVCEEIGRRLENLLKENHQ